MKDCKKIHLLLSLHQEGELSASDRASVDKHLQVCVTARREMEKLGRLRQALKGLPEPTIPSDLHGKIMARVTGSGVPLPTPRTFWNYSPWVLAAAGIAVFFTLTPYSSWKERGNQPLQQATRDEAAQKPAPAGADRSVGEKGFAPEIEPVSEKVGLTKSRQATSAPPAKKSAVMGNEQNVAMNYQAPAAEGRQDMDLKEKATADDLNVRAKAPAEAPAAPMASSASAGMAESAASLSMDSAAPAMPEPYSGSLVRSTTSKEPTRLWKGGNAPSAEERQELVTDAETFKGYWQVLYPKLAPPEVDFTKQAVVVLMAGERPTAGYSIQVSRLGEKEEEIVIHYRVVSPPADAVTAQVITRPWTLQVITKPTKPVTFIKEQ
jgi:hypothetical protein